MRQNSSYGNKLLLYFSLCGNSFIPSSFPRIPPVLLAEGEAEVWVRGTSTGNMLRRQPWCASVLSHIWLCDPTDCSLPGYSVHGIFQARDWSGLPLSSPGADGNSFSNTLVLMNFPGGSDGKASAYNVGDQVWSQGWEDLFEKEMATHSSILAWKIPWTEEPGRL